MTTHPSSRRYGGLTTEERRTDRRARLLGTGASIWLREGWAAVSMRAVCSGAGLTDRYFYEEFDNVDDLLAALWDLARDRAITALLTEAAGTPDAPARDRLGSAIAAFVKHLAAHPDDARMLYGDSLGCPVLEARRRSLTGTGIDLLAEWAEPLLAAEVDREDFRVLVRMALGGFLELMAGWQAGDIAGDVDEIVAHAARFGDLLAASVVD